MILTYDPIPEFREDYFRYVLGEFVPALEHLGLSMCEIWHTAYGSYPLRLAGFLAPDRDTMEKVVASEEFLDLESRLQNYVINYSRRLVPQSQTFQF